MSEAMPRRVCVVGPGAVGCYFGGMLARSGAEVVLCGRPGSRSPHLQAIRAQGIEIDGVEVRGKFPVRVADDYATGLAEVDMVLLAVKSQDTEAAGRELARHLGDVAVVVSLQNGIDNVERLAALGVLAVPTVVFVAAAIERPGVVRHRGRGDLIVGAREDQPGLAEAARRVSKWFESAGVPCPVAEDIRRAQWIKLALNSMTNAVSALTGASYRAVAEFEPTWELALAVGREAIEVAAAEGVRLDLDELVEMAMGIVHNIGEATSSTEQDIAAGRRTEIDALNGYISRRGRELGVTTPTNDALQALVKLRERQTPQSERSTDVGESSR